MEITDIVLIIVSLATGLIFAIRYFCRRKYGCGFGVAFFLPATVIVIGVILNMIYRIMRWGTNAQ